MKINSDVLELLMRADGRTDRCGEANKSIYVIFSCKNQTNNSAVSVINKLEGHTGKQIRKERIIKYVIGIQFPTFVAKSKPI